MRTNERKYFTSYIVERDDTLWDIAGRYMTPEYDSIESYIEEVMESNHLHNDRIREGQMLILPIIQTDRQQIHFWHTELYKK